MGELNKSARQIVEAVGGASASHRCGGDDIPDVLCKLQYCRHDLRHVQFDP